MIVFAKAKLVRRHTNSTISVSLLAGMTDTEWRRFVEIKFPGWAVQSLHDNMYVSVDPE